MDAITALKRGWNDALEGRPFDNAMSFGPQMQMDLYEMGRLMIASLRAKVGNGEQPTSAWTERRPVEFEQAMRLYHQNIATVTMEQRLEQDLMHRGPVDEARERLYVPARKRRRAARLRW